MKKLINTLIILSSCLLLTGCQLGYLIQSGYHQALLIKNQEDINEALKSKTLTDEQKRKIQLAVDAKLFAQEHLGLAITKNYTTYVQLDRPYVSYLVQAALPMELKYHYWKFPIVGKIPYKGYFKEEDAKKEAQKFKDQGLDTFVRGVRAFSTLGWLKDPILSPMTSYSDDDLVNLIIHETTHATLYIKSAADFNEQLATFVGNKGTELFYIQKEGKNSTTLQLIKNKNKDDVIFSQFIQKELSELENWYAQKPDPSLKEKRLEEIKEKFKKLNFKTDSYKYFSKMNLNNAVLLGYKTYFNDLSQFEVVYSKSQNMKDFIQKMKSLQGSNSLEADIKKL